MRPIDKFDYEPPLKLAKDIGRPSELKWIPLRDLFIDHEYQREILGRGQKNIRRIAETFNWAHFSPVIVAKRSNGRYAVIDGQHRVTAAKARGDIEAVPAVVLHLDKAAEAAAFSAINGTVTRLSALHVFRARVAAQEPGAVAISAICVNVGVSVAPYPIPAGKLKPGQTLAVGTLEVCYKLFGPDLLSKSLALLMNAGGENSVCKATIHGACIAFSNTTIGISEAIKLVAPRGVATLLTASLRRQLDAGGKDYSAFAAMLTSVLRPPQARPKDDSGFIRTPTGEELMRGRA